MKALSGRRFWEYIALGVAAVGTLWAGRELVREAAHLVRERTQATGAAEEVRGDSLPAGDLDVRYGAGQASRVRTDTIDRGLLLVFDPTCTACRYNMGNWAEMLACNANGAGEASVVALSVERPGDSGPTLARLSGSVTVSRLSAGELAEKFGIERTPYTALVEQGRISRTYTGVVNEAQQRVIERFLGCRDGAPSRTSGPS